MAILYYTQTITATPQKFLVAPNNGGDRIKVYLSNNDAVNHVFIGDSTVTAGTGYEVINQTGSGIGNRAEFELYAGETLWAVCAATKTAQIAVIVSGA